VRQISSARDTSARTAQITAHTIEHGLAPSTESTFRAGGRQIPPDHGRSRPGKTAAPRASRPRCSERRQTPRTDIALLGAFTHPLHGSALVASEILCLPRFFLRGLRTASAGGVTHARRGLPIPTSGLRVVHAPSLPSKILEPRCFENLRGLLGGSRYH